MEEKDNFSRIIEKITGRGKPKGIEPEIPLSLPCVEIEDIRRVEELVDRLVEAAKEHDIKMIHGYEELKKDLLGIFIEDVEEQIKDKGNDKDGRKREEDGM